MEDTTVRVGRDFNEKLRELKTSLLVRNLDITQKELLERMIDYSLKHKMRFLREEVMKEKKKDPLRRIIEKPDKGGPKTNCVKEIDLVVTSG